MTVELAADKKDATLYVEVPSFRHDLEREIDLVEEVARLNGYDKIPVTMPVGRSICHTRSESTRVVKGCKDILVSSGFSEVVNYSFVSPSFWDLIGLDSGDARRNNVSIVNPLTEEQSVMRTSLVPSLLQTVSRNLAYRT